MMHGKAVSRMSGLRDEKRIVSSCSLNGHV